LNEYKNDKEQLSYYKTSVIPGFEEKLKAQDREFR
jgi:hypothetical protein